MDAEDKDVISQKVQGELNKLKQAFKCSADSQNWVQSEIVCRCTDEEFQQLLKGLSYIELEAAALILQRHIDLEKQVWKCLENLKSVQSEWDGKTIDCTQKIIASQRKVARLRSRLLRCLTQQLYKNGSLSCELPPWSGDVFHALGRDEDDDDDQVRQEESLQDNDSMYSNVQDEQNIASNSAYENLEIQSEQSTQPEHAGKNSTAEKNDGKNNYYEPVALKPQPSRPAPSRPIPYAVTRKLSGKSGSEVDHKSLEKDDKPVELSSPSDNSQGDDQDGLIAEQQFLQDWDPTPVLQELFGNVRALPTPQLRTSEGGPDNIRMAGYMEKQPVRGNLKRASVFKGWKKRHFKAVGGKLYYYEDHRAREPLGFVNLIGCTVKKMEEKFLEVTEQTQGGRSVKLKCSSAKEAEDWKEALEAESAASLEGSLGLEESSATEGLTIIIDLGSNAVKAGFAQEGAWPQVIFPCVVAVDKENSENCKYGYDALLPETRKTSRLHFPLRKSLKIDKLRIEIQDLIGIFEHVFDKLRVEPSKHKVIMTLPHGCGPQEKEELVELLLDIFKVEACYLQEQAVLSMYSYSAISGIVVDIGDHIDIIPVVEGCMIEAGVTRLPYGGRQITDSFTRLLTEKGIRLFSEVESYISRAIKEKVSLVAKRDVQEDTEADYTMEVDLEKYSIPDGTRKITVDSARYRCTEGLFKPSVWGKDNPGIHQLTVNAIMACSIDIRKQMCRNIYLSGGGSMSPGLAERLQEEVSELMPSTSHVQVHAGLERQHAAFIGASVVAKLPLFEELCVFKEDWDENGPEALEKWLTL